MCPPIAYWQQPLLSEWLLSSKVRNSTPLCCHAGEARIFVTHSCNQASPTDNAQSWMSLHIFGVIQTYWGSALAWRSASSWLNGTILLQRAGLPRILSKYIKGLCFCRYSLPESPTKHGLG